MSKMNPVVKQKWIERLRELPNDMQAQGVLRKKDGKMCCLGVLTEIAVEEGVIEPGELSDDVNTAIGRIGCYAYEDREKSDKSELWYGITPLTVTQWAGLPAQNPEINVSDGHTLSELNDFGMYNFDQIADVIEEQL